MNQIDQDLLESVRQLTIIDTHEHLDEENRVINPPGGLDMLGTFFLAYFSGELAARLEPLQLAQLQDPGTPLLRRWEIFEPVWRDVRYTGTGQVIEIAARDVYGVPQVDRGSVSQLDDSYRGMAKPGLYRHVLSDLCRIKVSINDRINDMRLVENPLFKFVARIDPMVRPANAAAIMAFGLEHQVRIRTVEDFEEACAAHLDKVLTQGVIGLKCGLAYLRPLFFEEAGRSLVEDEWARMMESGGAHLPPSIHFQNYMMHRVLAEAERRGLVLQVHTGILAGRGNLGNTDPVLLNNLFLRYANLKFDLFHIGFPYHDRMAALVKICPNVFIDMCWAHVVSPQTSANILDEWLECVPANKIMGFGGDYVLVAGVYGHLELARRNIARVLAGKIASGLLTRSQAKKMARMLLYDNPAALFHLE